MITLAASVLTWITVYPLAPHSEAETPEAKYVRDVHRLSTSVPFATTPAGSAALVRLGYATCSTLDASKGVVPVQVAVGMVYDTIYDEYAKVLSPSQASDLSSSVVAAATTDLCPGNGYMIDQLANAQFKTVA